MGVYGAVQRDHIDTKQSMQRDVTVYVHRRNEHTRLYVTPVIHTM